MGVGTDRGEPRQSSSIQLIEEPAWNYGMEGKLFRISTMYVLHGRDVEKSDSWLMAVNRYEALVLLQDLFIPKVDERSITTM